MRKLAFLGIITGLIFLGAIPLHADDTELFTGSVPPDALIALDLSGSMLYFPGGEKICQDNSSCAQPFGIAPTQPNSTCPNAPYTNRCESRYWSGGAYVYYKWSDASCSGPFYSSSGPGHDTDCSRVEIAKRTIFNLLDTNRDGKLQKVDEDTLNVEMGYMRFVNIVKDDASNDYNSGNNMLMRGFDFDYSGLYNLIKNDTKPDKATALVLQMSEAKKYLDDHKAGDTAKECRKKFVILISDGGDNLSCGGDHTDANGDGVPDRTELQTRSFGYMHRKATVAAAKAFVDAGYQVFTVGFGANMSASELRTLQWTAYYGGTYDPSQTQSVDPSKIALLTPAEACQEDPACFTDPVTHIYADSNQIDCWWSDNDPGGPNGKWATGYAFFAQDASGLSRALQSIFKYIREKALTFTAPTVPSVRLTDAENVFISSFTPSTNPFWKGDLKAYVLNPDGTLPVDAHGFPIQEPLWEASSLLGGTSPDTRNILTAKSGSPAGSQVSFTAGNLTNAALGVASDAERTDLVNHVRGYDPWDTDQDGETTDTRAFKLGDIFHSQAVIVGSPSRSFIDDGFNGTGGFYDTKKNRTKVIVVGANDGMLHAFDAATGVERWAFIPPALLANLKTMKDNWNDYKLGLIRDHLYYVDGSPRVSDVWFYSSSTDTTKTVGEWKTVLVDGLRKGGKAYFALDVTDTVNPSYLWEFPDPNSADYATTLAVLGQSWSDPTIGRVKIEVGSELYERWVAFIGGGWDAREGRKESLEAAEGRAFFVVDIKTGQILWQFKYGATGENSEMKYSLPAPATAVDTNSDGYVDRVYIGDLGGQIWSFDLSFNPITKKSNSLWSGRRIFKAPASVAEKHTFYYQPAVAFDNSGTPWVFIGSGDRENPREGGIEMFLAVKDDGLGTYPRLKDNLSDVTDTNTFTPPADPYKGWYLKLANWKEQALSKPAVFNNLVYFTTFSPRESLDDCTPGAGTARLYVLHYLSGGGGLEVDELSDLYGAAGTRSTVIGSGLPSAPVLSIDTYGKATVIIGTTENQIFSQEAFSPDTNKQIIYWREVFD